MAAQSDVQLIADLPTELLRFLVQHPELKEISAKQVERPVVQELIESSLSRPVAPSELAAVWV